MIMIFATLERYDIPAVSTPGKKQECSTLLEQFR